MIATPSGPLGRLPRSSERRGDPGPRLFAAVGTSVIARGAGAALGMAAAVLLAALLGAGEYGRFAYTVSLAALFAPVAALGLDVLATREVARARSVGDAGRQRLFVRWALAAGAVSAVISAALVQSALLLVSPLLRTELTDTVGWVSGLLVPMALLRIVAGILLGEGRVGAAHLVQFAVPPTVLGLGALLLAATGAGPDPARLLAVHCLGLFASLLCGLGLVRQGMPPTDGRSVWDRIGWWREVPGFTGLALAGVASGQIGTPIAGTLAGPSAAAVFDLATRASGLVALGLGAVNAPVAPLIARLWEQRRLRDLQAAVVRVRRLATAGATLATALLLAGAIPLAAASGSHWSALPATLGLLCAGQLVNAACGPVGWLLAMSGHEKRVFAAQASAAAIQLVLAVPLTVTLGPVGTAAACAFGLTMWNVDLRRVVRRRLGLR